MRAENSTLVARMKAWKEKGHLPNRHQYEAPIGPPMPRWMIGAGADYPEANQKEGEDDNAYLTRLIQAKKDGWHLPSDLYKRVNIMLYRERIKGWGAKKLARKQYWRQECIISHTAPVYRG